VDLCWLLRPIPSEGHEEDRGASRKTPRRRHGVRKRPGGPVDVVRAIALGTQAVMSGRPYHRFARRQLPSWCWEGADQPADEMRVPFTLTGVSLVEASNADMVAR